MPLNGDFSGAFVGAQCVVDIWVKRDSIILINLFAATSLCVGGSVAYLRGTALLYIYDIYIYVYIYI